MDMKTKAQIPEEIINRINNIYWKYTTGPQTIKKLKDLAVLTSMSSFGKDNHNGPIGVAKCILNGEEKVTLMMLGGTQIKEGQATTMEESKLATKGEDNDYLDAIIEVFKSKDEKGDKVIDKDIPIIISGISLGGMVAQQLLGKEEIINNYKIKSILCIGSPIIKPLDRKGIRVKRFIEKGDIVPKLEAISLKVGKKRKIKKELNEKERILENSNYKTLLESHALSYVESEKFDKYDFYGELNGKNELEILENVRYFEAPKKGIK